MSVLLTIAQSNPSFSYGSGELRIGRFDYKYANYCADLTHPDSRNLLAFNNISTPPAGSTMFVSTLGVAGGNKSAFGDNFEWTPTELRGIDNEDVHLKNTASQPPIIVSMVTDPDTYEMSLRFKWNGTTLGTISLGYNQGFYLNSSVTRICLVGDYNSAGNSLTSLRIISYATSVFDANGNYRKPAWILGGVCNQSIVSKFNEYVLSYDNKQELLVEEYRGMRYLPTKSGAFRIMECPDRALIGGESVDWHQVSYFNERTHMLGLAPKSLDEDPVSAIGMLGHTADEQAQLYEAFTEYFNFTFRDSGIDGVKLGTDILHPSYIGALGDLSTVERPSDPNHDIVFEINESTAKFRLHAKGDGQYQLIIENDSTILQTIELYYIPSVWGIGVGSIYRCCNMFICKQPTLGWTLCGIFYNDGTLECKHLAQFDLPVRQLFEEYTVTLDTEYETPEQELSDNTEKTRRGKDDNGVYTEVWDDDTKTWKKTYDYERTHSGERGKGDGSSDPDEGNEKIDAPSTDKLTPSDCGLFTIFSPTPQQLRNFSYHLNSSSALEEIGKWFRNNPMDGIFGLSMIPYDVPIGENKYPSIGNYTISVALAKASEDVIIFDYGTIRTDTFKECSGDFLDYSSATSVSIFLPHIGFKELDVDLVMGRTLKLQYLIYVATGDIIAYLYAGDLLLYQWQGNCALQLPITHTDYSTCISNAVSLVANGVSSAVTQNPIPLAIGLANGIQGINKPNLMTSGSVKGNGSFYTSEQAYLVVSRPEMMIEDVKNFNHTFGRSSAESVIISSINGYTEFEDIDVSNINCTKEEKDRILDYMKGGFFA